MAPRISALRILYPSHAVLAWMCGLCMALVALSSFVLEVTERIVPPWNANAGESVPVAG